MVINFENFLNWALVKEPTLIILTEDGAKKISDYSEFQLTEGYNDAIARCKSLRSYMNDANYKSLIYNYALHIAITNSTYETDNDNENIFDKQEPEEALQKLYLKYSIPSATIGIITSSSSGGSSASSQLPNSLTQADSETTFLITTVYGKTALYFLEQLNGIII